MRFSRSLKLILALAAALAAPLNAFAEGVRCEAVFAPSPLTVAKELSHDAVQGYRLRWGRHWDPGLKEAIRDAQGWRKAPPIMGRVGQKIFNGPVRWMSPLPLPRLRTGVGRLIHQIWDNPQREVTPAEFELLRKHGLENHVDQIRAFAERSKTWVKARKSFDNARMVTWSLLLFFALIQANDLSQNSVAEEEYLVDKSAEVPVHVLIETFPLPRTALRIGDQVYVYGAHKLARYELKDYLEKRGVGESSKGKKLSWRAIRFIELQISRAQTQALRADLESHLGDEYFNVTRANDAAAMLWRTIRRHGGPDFAPVLEAYPHLADAQHGISRALEGAVVGREGLIVTGGVMTSPVLLRNVWLTVVEAKFFVAHLVVTPAMWMGLDGYFDPEEEK